MNRQGKASSNRDRFTLPSRSKIAKTFDHLFEQVCTFDNLLLAYRKARRCKRYRSDVLIFSRDLEENLLRLQSELLTGTFRTGKYFEFIVTDRKRRIVRALPFRDRVVHHAICGIIEPLFERQFIYDSYACRTGKGTHRAVDRLQYFLRCAKARWGTFYILKADIEHYFPSIHHGILKSILAKTIRDKRLLVVLYELIDSFNEPGTPNVGLPIGNLTSQLFANIYLNELDHTIKERLHCQYFCRYMDDFLIVAADKEELHDWLLQIEVFLKETLGLKYNRKTRIFPDGQGVDFLGYRVWATHCLLLKGNKDRARRRIKQLARQYAARQIDLKETTVSIQSWIAHAKHACTYNLRRDIFRRVIFKKKL